jgi:transcriptional regulator with XRE-family HTH domain
VQVVVVCYGSATAKGDDKTTPLGDRVRKRRKALGLTAKAVAKAAGVSTSYISQLERGYQQDPSLPMLRRLAVALSMDLYALMGAHPGTATRLAIPTSLRRLADAYHLPTETVGMLAGVNIEGRQPTTTEDWLFLWLAVRRACNIDEPLTPAPTPEVGASTGP